MHNNNVIHTTQIPPYTYKERASEASSLLVLYIYGTISVCLSISNYKHVAIGLIFCISILAKTNVVATGYHDTILNLVLVNLPVFLSRELLIKALLVGSWYPVILTLVKEFGSLIQLTER